MSERSKLLSQHLNLDLHTADRGKEHSGVENDIRHAFLAGLTLSSVAQANFALRPLGWFLRRDH
jgi:hypothetical protein